MKDGICMRNAQTRGDAHGTGGRRQDGVRRRRQEPREAPQFGAPLAEKPRVLVIDNFDSFTYNLVQLIGSLNAEPVVRRNDAVSLAGIRDLSPAALVISPGPGHPAIESDVGISIAAIREFSGRIPVLGVCLGHQAIVHAFGGKVVRAGKPMHGKTSEIEYVEGGKGGIFSDITAPFVVMRYHSLVGERSSLPPCLEITATSRDDGEIMAVRHTEHMTFGLQFHPESIFTVKGPAVIGNFLRYAGVQP